MHGGGGGGGEDVVLRRIIWLTKGCCIAYAVLTSFLFPLSQQESIRFHFVLFTVRQNLE